MRLQPGVVGVGGAVPFGGGGRTYAEFQAHIATLATSGSQGWGLSLPGPARAVRTTAAAAEGAMAGSSWASIFGASATTCRVVQHGLPSEAVFNDQVANGREIFFQTTAPVADSTLVSLTRNGFTSGANSGVNSATCTDLIYWDGTAAQRMNPSTGTGPTPYTF